MNVALTLTLCYLAAVLFYGADSTSPRPRTRRLGSRLRSHAARGVALALVLFAVHLGGAGESGFAAPLFVLAALTTSSSIVTLLGSVLPRTVWTLAAVGAVAAAALALGGALS